jgi:hypothetical protein
MTQNKQYIEKYKNFGRARAVPRLCGFCPGICLTTEEKARENLCQCSRIMPAGTMKIHKYTIRIHRHNNKNTYNTVLKRNTTNMAVLYYFISILVKVSDGGLNRDRNM